MTRGFEGIWIPIVTPFRHGQIDKIAFVHLALQLAGSGIAGIVACATTGEGASLSSAEREVIVGTLRDVLGAHYPIMVGLSAASTEFATVEARAIAALRPTALLVTAPPYVRPSQQGIQRHFEQIVEAADLPLIVYNIPYRTGINIEVETLQKLSRDARVCALKECGGDTHRLMRLLNETSLSILAGDDVQIFFALCLGAHGAITAAAHVRPELYVRMFECLRAQKLDEARKIATALHPVICALFAEPSPAPIKAFLAQYIGMAPDLRLPMVVSSEACLTELLRAEKSLDEALA